MTFQWIYVHALLVVAGVATAELPPEANPVAAMPVPKPLTTIEISYLVPALSFPTMTAVISEFNKVSSPCLTFERADTGYYFKKHTSGFTFKPCPDGKDNCWTWEQCSSTTATCLRPATCQSLTNHAAKKLCLKPKACGTPCDGTPFELKYSHVGFKLNKADDGFAFKVCDENRPKCLVRVPCNKASATATGSPCLTALSCQQPANADVAPECLTTVECGYQEPPCEGRLKLVPADSGVRVRKAQPGETGARFFRDTCPDGCFNMKNCEGEGCEVFDQCSSPVGARGCMRLVECDFKEPCEHAKRIVPTENSGFQFDEVDTEGVLLQKCPNAPDCVEFKKCVPGMLDAAGNKIKCREQRGCSGGQANANCFTVEDCTPNGPSPCDQSAIKLVKAVSGNRTKWVKEDGVNFKPCPRVTNADGTVAEPCYTRVECKIGGDTTDGTRPVEACMTLEDCKSEDEANPQCIEIQSCTA